MKLRQEINILSGEILTSTTGGAVSSKSRVQLDMSWYTTIRGVYTEFVVKNTNATTSYNVSILGSSDGTVNSVSVPANTTSYTRKRAANSFNISTPVQDFQAQINQATGANGDVSIKSARIIIIYSITSLIMNETQLEIGNQETAKTNTTAAALSSPKYWLYTAANWDGTKTFYAEVTYLNNASKSGTTTITLQEDNGSFASFANIVTIVSAGTASSATRVRSAAFTPTDGRHYRIAALSSSSKASYDIYNAKIIVDQTSNAKDYNGASSGGTLAVQGGTGGSGETTQAEGQSFTASSSYSLAYVQLQILKSGSPLDGMTLEVLSGSITGTVLATSDVVSGSSITIATPTVVLFTFSSPTSLTNGVKYYLRLTRTGSRDTLKYYGWYGSTTSNYANGGSLQESNSAWTSENATNDVTFWIYAALPVSITRSELQHLLLNTKSTATGLQSFNTLFDIANEWQDVNLVCKHAQDGIGAGANTKLTDITPSPDVDLTNSSVTGANQQISSQITNMPSSADEIDSNIVAAGTEVDASRILVAVSPALVSNWVAPVNQPLITPDLVQS